MEEIAATACNYFETRLMTAKQHYYDAISKHGPGEVACVGGGLGGEFTNTSELHVMKYKLWAQLMRSIGRKPL